MEIPGLGGPHLSLNWTASPNLNKTPHLNQGRSLLKYTVLQYLITQFMLEGVFPCIFASTFTFTSACFMSVKQNIWGASISQWSSKLTCRLTVRVTSTVESKFSADQPSNGVIKHEFMWSVIVRKIFLLLTSNSEDKLKSSVLFLFKWLFYY